jgi:hypothetical protein
MEGLKITTIVLALCYGLAAGSNDHDLYCEGENFCGQTSQGEKIYTGNNCRITAELDKNIFLHTCQNGEIIDIRRFVPEQGVLRPSIRGIGITSNDIHSICRAFRLNEAGSDESLVE